MYLVLLEFFTCRHTDMGNLIWQIYTVWCKNTQRDRTFRACVYIGNTMKFMGMKERFRLNLVSMYRQWILPVSRQYARCFMPIGPKSLLPRKIFCMDLYWTPVHFLKTGCLVIQKHLYLRTPAFVSNPSRSIYYSVLLHISTTECGHLQGATNPQMQNIYIYTYKYIYYKQSDVNRRYILVCHSIIRCTVQTVVSVCN